MRCWMWAIAGIVTACAGDVKWEVGAARVSITPDRPVWLAGYTRDGMSEGVHDDIWARAMAIDDGSTTVLILAADLIGLMLPDVNDIRRELAKDVPANHIIVTSTHNHSGPDVIGLWHIDQVTSGVDFAYLDTVKARMVRAGLAALQAREPASLFLSRNEVPGISYNARDEGILDTEAVTLRAERVEDGQTIGILVNFACHPEVLTKQNKRVTSDFAHYAYGRLEEKLGGVAVYVNGALGGMVTPLVTANSFREAARCGHTLADSVVSGMRGEQLVLEGRLRSIREPLALAMDNSGFRTLAEAGVIHRQFSDSIRTEVGALSIGSLLIATVPGEALPSIGFALKSAMKSNYRMVFGLANDELGYLIPSSDWRENEYEETMSLGKTAGDVVLRETLRLIEDL